ncbi:MAG: hypothetical protein RJA81_2138 [Planctomycetota bacterium]
MKFRIFVILCVFWLSTQVHNQLYAQFFGPFFGPAYAPYESPTKMVQNRRPITQNVGGPVTSAPSNPNAYWNHLREPVPNYTMTPRTDIRRGIPGIDTVSTRSRRTSSGTSENKPRDNAQHFLGFFNEKGVLVWPNDAPLEGELSGKRAKVDLAMTDLRSDLVQNRKATVAKIVTSRNDLLDYGRPALAFLRDNRPTQADSFHAWLLELYNTIGKMAE